VCYTTFVVAHDQGVMLPVFVHSDLSAAVQCNAKSPCICLHENYIMQLFQSIIDCMYRVVQKDIRCYFCDNFGKPTRMAV